MTLYIIRRFIQALFIVWAVLTVTFILLQLAPGDPASMYIRPEIDPQTIENIREQMGLNQPVFVQYFIWLKAFLTGNFGFSFSHMRPVVNIFAEAIPNTLQLTTVVFIVQIIGGVLLGMALAIVKMRCIRFALNSFLLISYSTPGFLIAIIALWIFSVQLEWLPPSHMQSLLYEGTSWALFFDRIKHLILPAGVLSLPAMAYTAKIFYASYTDVLAQDYIRTARAYGLPRRSVLFKYALRNALLPLVSSLGLFLPFLFGGTVIIESIFSWPGMGKLTVDAIFSHDFPIILATTFIAAFSVVLGNFLADVAYLFIDPRVKPAYEV
ncbi:MAG: ABC transporter permease [Deferribacteres bacterium]|nr:ABC transporter permease [candidate division KSB1 bacterium]MCB9503290.1 ABC transporter permease [Deferribacteres bacterium]